MGEHPDSELGLPGKYQVGGTYSSFLTNQNSELIFFGQTLAFIMEVAKYICFCKYQGQFTHQKCPKYIRICKY